jgi:hypothetical protein
MFKVFEPSRDEDEGREEERKQRQDIKRLRPHQRQFLSQAAQKHTAGFQIDHDITALKPVSRATPLNKYSYILNPSFPSLLRLHQHHRKVGCSMQVERSKSGCRADLHSAFGRTCSKNAADTSNMSSGLLVNYVQE